MNYRVSVCAILFVDTINFFPMAQQPREGQDLLIIEASTLHSDTPHPLELLWTGDQPDAETST
jgi:hypothetical protein